MALLLVLLATFRLTRLLAVDEFPPTAAARDAVAERWGADSWQSYLSECPWCVSMYVGGLVVAGTLLAGVSLAAPVLAWWAASAFTGLTSTVEGALGG